VSSDSNDALEDVSETALGAAEMRAEESLRADRCFDDPFAAAFVAAAPPLFPDLPSINDDPALAALKDAFLAGMTIRTRFYDDQVSAARAAGCRQVVLLAAGLDTRAFRLDWPSGVQLFELDLPELFEFKEGVLSQKGAAPRCSRRIVGVDLREDWPARLVAAGFDRDVPTAWTAEGLLPYLSNDDVLRLLTSVGDLSASGSQLSFEYDEFREDSTLSRARAMPGMQEVVSMWKGGMTEDPAQWLRDHHWHVRTDDRARLAASYRAGLAEHASGSFLTAIHD
jgi:methyltransferase (TIGR00027 family)